MEGAAIDVGPGEAVFIPRGAVHRFENAGEANAKAVVIVTPGVLGSAYFRELAVALDASPGDAPDSAAIAEVMRRHGLTLA
jgi:hypothetical protein